MYKVFVVEDEMVLRNGVRENVKWDETNFIFTGDAADGEEALPLIREILPDILITDIKMPFMNGLELSKIVKREIPDIKIIVLTGYDEFDFAREALSIGVSEYLLKPFSASKLLEVLDKTAEKIKDEKSNKIRDYEKYVVEKNTVHENEKDEAFEEEKMYKYDESFINDFIRLGNSEEIEVFLDEYINRIENNAIRSYLYTCYSFMNIVIISSNFINELGGSIDIVIPETKDLERLCLNLNTADEFKKHVRKVISSVINYRDDKKANKYADVIIKSKDYIDKNYSKSTLSLNSVASHVNMSPNHLSMLFKQETGESFIEYLTNFRIKKAMEILQTSSMRSLEVAAAVGYSDPHYFSRLFKKIVNCTPTEFRNKS